MARLLLRRGDSANIKQKQITDGELINNTATKDLLVYNNGEGIPALKATRTSTAQEATGHNKFTTRNNVITGEDYLPVIDLGVVHNGTTNYTCRLTQRVTEGFGDTEHDQEWFLDLPLIADTGIFHVLTRGLPHTAEAVASSGLTGTALQKQEWYRKYMECMDWAYALGIKVLIDVRPNSDVIDISHEEEFKAQLNDHPAVSGFTDNYNMVYINKSSDPQGIMARDIVIDAIADSTTPTVAVIETVIEREPVSFQVEAATRSGVQLSYFSEWKRDRDGSLGTVHSMNTTGENPYAVHMIGFGADYIYGNKLPNKKRSKIEIFSDDRDLHNKCLTGGSLTMPMLAADGTTRQANLLDIHGGHHGVSVSFWVRKNGGDITGTKNIITRQADNGKYGYRIEAVDGHLTVASQWHDPSLAASWLGGETFTDPNPISDDWDFFVFQADNVTKRVNLYRNGARLYEIDTADLNYTSPYTDGILTMLGDGGYDLAQITYYYRELEQKEINTLYVYDLIPARDIYKNRWSGAVARFDLHNESLSDSIGFVTVVDGMQFSIDTSLVVPDLTANNAVFGTFTKPTYRKVK